MTAPEPTSSHPGDVPVDETPPATSAAALPSLRAVGAFLLLIGLAAALDGLVGGLAVVVVAAVLLAGLPTRLLGLGGVLCLAGAPIAVLVRGVPTSEEVSPAFVVRSLLPHHLTFAGLVLVCAFAVIDLAPHLQAWAALPRADQDDGPPLGAVVGTIVVVVVSAAALLACAAVLGT